MIFLVQQSFHLVCILVECIPSFHGQGMSWVRQCPQQKFDRHLNEYEGKFTVNQVGTYSFSSQHEQNHEDNQRRMMTNNEELIELLQTETNHLMKTNEQSLKQAKPIFRISSRRGDPVDD